MRATPPDREPRACARAGVVRWAVAAFNGVKIFSATMFADRGQLGERITAWIANGPARKMTDIIVTQSSDAAFHCVTISIFYHEAVR
ncbi:MAG TPA: hypothetical protein VHW23_22545 [Kofleriaceae bacterium]|nr:hypothetical protein [Kofleriaceae bacterium]